jgi:hypothetical protein
LRGLAVRTKTVQRKVVHPRLEAIRNPDLLSHRVKNVVGNLLDRPALQADQVMMTVRVQI